jgi:CubicO group peptidase (beta-lactamase class C family)
VRPLALIETWPVPTAAAATLHFDGAVERHGPTTHVFRLASLSKLVLAWAVLVAVEEGSLSLEAPIGQPGCTLRHLLSHAGGYPFEGAIPVATPGRRRIYSNTGIEMAADALTEATGIALADYLDEAVLQPLGMRSTELRGSPAHAMWGTVDDLIRFVNEIISPTLLSHATVHDATSPQFPDLAGVVPGLGMFRPCPWGLGPEIRGDKHPHWTGGHNSPATFGHFGGAGTMMWIDPVNERAVIALTDRKFDEWADEALRLWPELSDAVLADEVANSPVS